VRARAIPPFVDFGLGKVTIERVSRVRMRQLDGGEVGDCTPDGLWDCDVDTIYIGDWLTGAKLRRVFWHEMIHAIIDMDYASVGSR